jgi:diguanylate cyclase (GGDEF)-like protein
LIGLIDRQRLWFKSCQGLMQYEFPRNAAFCSHTILGEGPLVVADTLQDPRFGDSPLVKGAPRVRFYAGVPLHAPDGLRIGAFSVMDEVPHEFSDDDLHALCDLGALADRELHMQEHATTDELTALPNRRGLLIVGKHVLQHCKRYSLTAAVVTLNIDGFRAFNERHGQHVGNNVLRSLAGMLQNCFRDADVVARPGGDEFTVVACGASFRLLAQTLDRLRREFAGSEMARRFPGLSWNAGIADYDPCHEPDIEALLIAAQSEMRKTKGLSRNPLVNSA